MQIANVASTVLADEAVKTILVLDDQEPFRLFIAPVLERAGYQTLVAASGAEAIETARCHNGSIDLLLTDFQMPGLSGIDVASHISGVRRETRVLIMTGADPRAVKPERGWGLLEKPFTSQELLEAVRHALTTDTVKRSEMRKCTS